ncbi:hypothetical protein L596_012657 [Steinernema carpocapsae]|uniref:Uncharacterized protein n=1 Tax=Steinernema carpocapsae TaxID=34508 RepID=A0A4U5NYM9_STECR|nr:hypothetical protein L596_012657 [Steinernema carpocapsae]
MPLVFIGLYYQTYKVANKIFALNFLIVMNYGPLMCIAVLSVLKPYRDVVLQFLKRFWSICKHCKSLNEADEMKL